MEINDLLRSMSLYGSPTSPSSYVSSGTSSYGTYAPQPIVVGIVGASGCGKSTFINTIEPSFNAPVSDRLSYASSVPRLYQLSMHPYMFYIIELPGLKDNADEGERLGEMLTDATMDHGLSPRIHGLIFLQALTLPRWTGSLADGLVAACRSCKLQSYSGLVLGTTCSDLMSDREATRKENELYTNHWADLANAGATMTRITNNQQAALNVLMRIAVNASSFNPSQSYASGSLTPEMFTRRDPAEYQRRLEYEERRLEDDQARRDREREVEQRIANEALEAEIAASHEEMAAAAAQAQRDDRAQQRRYKVKKGFSKVLDVLTLGPMKREVEEYNAYWTRNMPDPKVGGFLPDGRYMVPETRQHTAYTTKPGQGPPANIRADIAMGKFFP